jgi:flagellar motor switch/type III secretory pathway protein FliN
LLFLGERRRAALTGRVAASARRWRQAWSPQSAETFDVTCESPQPTIVPVAGATTSAWELCAGGEPVAVLLLPHATFAWCVHENGDSPLDGAAAVAPGSLAGELEREVARELLIEACGAGKRDVDEVRPLALDELGAWARAARAWKLQVKSPASRGFTLLISSARLDSLAPARTVSGSQPLAARREAVGDNTVTLRAIVGETHLPVGDLAGLALDDVLVLDQPLAEPVTIVCGQSATSVAAGNLGRAGARRAIKITGAAAPRN